MPSVSAANLSSSSRVVTDVARAASSARSLPKIERGECEAIRLLRLMVECSYSFLSDFEAEQCGTQGGKEAFEGAENFVSARRRAWRLLRSWELPDGGRVWKMRRYSYAQLREVARLHAEGLSTCAIAKRVGMTHWSVHYHLGPSGSMQAAMLDVPLAEVVCDHGQCGGDSSLLSGERSLPARQEKPQQAAKPVGGARLKANKPCGVARAQKAAKGGAA